MKQLTKPFIFGLVALIFVCTGSIHASESAQRGPIAGEVLLLRHALAPGFGDPENFRIDDCSTQRNLNQQGRRQARAIGSWLKNHGTDHTQVYSSQWCRCLETARLMNIGDVIPLPALNSFFQRPSDRQPKLSALRAFFTKQAERSKPLILVTHQVTITALTGIFPDSGEGVLAKLGPNGRLYNFKRMSFD